MIRIIDHEGNGYGAQAEITRKKGVNGEKSLTGVIYTNEEVLHGVDRGWKLEFENEMYAFTFALPKDLGNQIELEFDAVHEFFYEMSKSSQNKLLNDGSHTFKAYLDFIFDDTDYNYRSDVEVQAFEKQNFGQKNRLDLFYDVIDTAGVEFSVNGSVVRIVERVGNDLSTVVKKGFNLNELQLEKNIGNFVTYQKGFGAWKDEEDHSKGRLEVEYLSPLAEIYGKLDADPVVDERYTNKSNLENRLKSNVEGSYQISVQIDMEDLTRAGYEYKQPHEGDSIMAINNDLGFQRKVRIVSYETDFDVEGNILDHRITCNSIGMVEESILSSNSIKNSIKELETDLELTKQQVIEFNVSADGKSTNYYGPIEPSPDDYKLRIGDTWFDSSGEDTIVKVWNGVEWRKSGADVDAIRREVEQAQQDISTAQATADEAVEQIDIAVANAGFTSLDETISSVQSISNQAQINAGTAIDNALEAMNTASLAVDNTGSLNVRVDDVENTLSIKADKQEVDDLTGVVDLQALDIQANAEGLALKANQDTVDTLAGTVQSLGTEFDIVAGQVSSKVWNTDIETAIDDLNYENRNLLEGNWDVSWDSDLHNNGAYQYLLRPRIQSIVDKVEIGDTLTFSFDVWAESDFTLRAYDSNGNPSISFGSHNIPVKAGSQRVSFTTKLSESSSTSSVWYLDLYNGNNGVKFSVSNIKIEKGNKATDWSPAPEDTLARFDHIETEWTQKFDSFSQTVSSIDGRVSKQEQTVSGMESVVYDPETGLSSLNTQLANLVQVAVTGEEMTGAISVLEDNLNLRLVAKDEVITQINASTEGILLQADKVQALADVVVDGKLTITDEFIAPNAQIDGAKIADATIGSAKIASLDVSKIVGNTQTFIQSNLEYVDVGKLTGNINVFTQESWNAISDEKITVDFNGIQSRNGSNGEYARIQEGGLNFYRPDTSGVGRIGSYYDSSRAERGVSIGLYSGYGYRIEKVLTGGNRRLFEVSQNEYIRLRGDSVTIESPLITTTTTNLNNGRVVVGSSVTNHNQNLDLRDNILYGASRIEVGSNIRFASDSHRIYDNNRTSLNIAADTNLNLGTNNNGAINTVVRVVKAGLQMFGVLNMRGYTITRVGELNYDSDKRLKDILGERTEDDLATIMAINYKNYIMNGKKQRGFIAQELRLIDDELVTQNEDGYLGYEGQGYVHTIGHAVQQLALKEENTNKIASQALQATETNAQKIERLEKRIEELEGVA